MASGSLLAEELLPPVEEAAQSEPAPASTEESAQFCPFIANVQNECGRESFTADGLFGPEGGVEAWSKNYSRVDRCKLWWWADHVQTWQYAPLTEWSSYMKDALMENIDRGIIFETIGLAPTPPYPKLNEKDRPAASCKIPTGEEWLFLSEKLRRLNLSNVSPELLYALVKNCLAFEVEASVWKRISTTVIASYVIPIGDLNFVVLAQTHVRTGLNPYKDRPEKLVEANHEVGVDLNMVGSCPVSKDPRNCVEEIIREIGRSAAAFGYPKGFTHTLGTLPFRPDVDSLYSGGGIDGPLNVEMRIEEDGNTYFFLLQKNGTRSRVTLTLGDDGGLAFETDERTCDPDNSEGKRLVLRPIAFPDRVKRLYKELAAYGPWDFPETKRNGTGGIEKGCKSGKTYSEWAAETANAAKHYAYHGMPWDTLFRSTAYQRYKWSLKSRGVPEIRDNLVFGLWRKDAQETPLLYGTTFEAQAAAFARQSNSDGEAKQTSITYRTIMIDEIPATEVWFYAKPISFWPGQSAQGRVVINHLKNYNEIYARSVIAKLTQLSTTCGELKNHKRGFLAAMYALFNAAPLQKGNDIVGKAFMAAAYHNLFGYKLRGMKKLVEIDFDAQTMGLDAFLEKYTPLI